ncbi:MAG TPA: competence/damage-inducible protein A, partial [Acidimicrobiia bacterium]
AEMIAERVDQQTNPTIAFLARGIEGIYVRMTAKAPTEDEARELLDAEDVELRKVLGGLVFAVDDDTME